MRRGGARQAKEAKTMWFPRAEEGTTLFLARWGLRGHWAKATTEEFLKTRCVFSSVRQF